MLYDLFLLLAAAYTNTFTQLVNTTFVLVNYPIAISYLFGPHYLLSLLLYRTLHYSMKYHSMLISALLIKIPYITVTILKVTHSLILIVDSLFSS